MNQRLFLWSVVAVSLAALVGFGVPLIGAQPDPLFSWRTGWCVAILVSQVAAAWYLLTNLSGFKSGLKKVALLLSAGAVFMGIAQLQLPLLTYINGWDTWYVLSGLVMLPYLITTIALYAAMRRFALLMSLRTAWTNRWIAAGVGIAGGVVAAALFWFSAGSNIDHSYDALIGWSEAMALATVIVVYRLRSYVTPTFWTILRWLNVAFYFSMAAGLQQLVLLHFTTGTWWYRYQGWSYWFFVVSSVAFLKMALEFRELSRGLRADANLLDVIVYTASLVSRPRDVEPILDRLRMVTAGLTQQAEPNEHQKRQLLQVYLDLEQYLVTHERLRKFTRKTLRLGLPEGFVAQLPRA